MSTAYRSLLGLLLSFLQENFPKNISFMERKFAELSAYKTRGLYDEFLLPFMERRIAIRINRRLERRDVTKNYFNKIIFLLDTKSFALS
jgi:hypothetical protein